MPRVNSEQYSKDTIRKAIMWNGICEWSEEPCDKQRGFNIYYRRPTPGVKNPYPFNDSDGIESVVWKELSHRGVPMRVCNYHEGLNATRLGYLGRKVPTLHARRGRPRKGYSL